MPELPPGYYKILSVFAGNDPLTGISGPGIPEFLPVRVGADLNIWRVKPQPEPGFYRLTLLNAPQFTGERDGTVIVTNDETLDKNWQIKYHDEHKGFSIAAQPLWPTPAWTVSSDTPFAEIRIKLYELFPGKDQLFTFEPVDQ